MCFLVGSNGLEPSTSRLSGVRSNHLSYEPISVAVQSPFTAYLCLSLSCKKKDAACVPSPNSLCDYSSY